MSIRSNDDGTPNVVTYLFTDNSGNRLEELPLRDVSFSLSLGAPGSFAGTLDVNDAGTRAKAWIGATAPNLAQVWVDIDGTLIYGGRVTRRTYRAKDGTVALVGQDHLSYLAQRLQAGDYASTWATVNTGAAQIAHQVISDALADANSLSLGLTTPAATPSLYGITLTSPRQQRASVDMLLNMISTLGFNVGFDYAIDVAYVAGVPTATVTLSYPRRGRVAGSTGLLMDLSQALDWSYDEDGSQQANQVAQTATGTGGVSTVGTYEPAMSVDGYPLLEKLAMHTNFSPSATPQSVLNAFASDDLALWSYPVTVLQPEFPMFSEPSIGEWIVGDDVRVISPLLSGPQQITYQGGFDAAQQFDTAQPFNQASVTGQSGTAATDPRFPAGLDFYFRITRADCTIPGEGIPSTKFTLGIPPATSPQRPPR